MGVLTLTGASEDRAFLSSAIFLSRLHETSPGAAQLRAGPAHKPRVASSEAVSTGSVQARPLRGRCTRGASARLSS